MGRASLLEEKRKMLFEDVYSVWTERRLTREEAAGLLGCARGRSGAWSPQRREKPNCGRNLNPFAANPGLPWTHDFSANLRPR